MSNRREFLQKSAMLTTVLTTAGLVPVSDIYADPISTSNKKAKTSGFTLWQLPCPHDPVKGGAYNFKTPEGKTISMPFKGNSYVFRTTNGKVIVMDGGVPPETGYLRGFLAAIGNNVEAWFLSHPHTDHVGVFHEILKNPGGIKIKTIYHSEFSKEYYESVEPKYVPMTTELYANLKKSDFNVENVTETGTVEIDRVQFKILAVKNEKQKQDAYNNSSMVIRVSDSVRSIVFLADSGVARGEELLNGKFRDDLNCDFLQMAHHGEGGVGKKFYQSIQFKACLWPTTKNILQKGGA
ncbi:MAG: MBL fold metallo-hydrolase, partial [Planctomycetaceae bacterium]|nr:MBL fold metallo-hydrolase [Planctomycetaceae bacterium]